MKEIILKLIDKFSTEGGALVFLVMFVLILALIFGVSLVFTGWKP